MSKQEFLARLREGLSGLPQEDIEDRLAFYGEMIDDRMEEGLTEEEAVAEIGPAEQAAAQIVAETPLPRIVKERIRSKRRMRAWEIVLLILGSPIWLSLLISAFAVLFSIYAVIWAVIISLWAAALSVAVGALGCVAAGVLVILRGGPVSGLLMFGAALVLAGLAILMFCGCLALSKGAVILTKKIALGIKSLFLRKENRE